MLFRSNDTATTEIYTLSLHDALPISSQYNGRPRAAEVLVDSSVARVIRPRETYQDLLPHDMSPRERK